MTTIALAEIGYLSHKLDRPIGGSVVSEVDLILCRLTDHEGAAGLGFTYVIGGRGAVVARQAKVLAERFLQGCELQPASVHWREISVSFNRTGNGINMVALAALDLAIWDLHAVRHGMPLATTMGGKARSVPVYASGEYSPGMDPHEAADIARAQIDAGMAGVKPRVSAVPADVALLGEVAKITSGHAWLMTDLNEKGDFARANWFLDVAKDHGVLFVEEPLPSSDMVGLKALARSTSTTIATGEHLQSMHPFATIAADRSASIFQPDFAMVGGMTPSIHIARLAEAHGAQVMPHFLPGLFVHLAATSPAVSMLEDFPLLEPLFSGMPLIIGGKMTPNDTAGHGLSIKEEFLSLVAWSRCT